MAKELRSAAHRALIRLMQERRAALKLNQEQLAAKLKVDSNVIWRLEAGERSLKFLEFPKLAKALEMTRAEFTEAIFGPED
jgi:transcriptional regulator with XRE-family HTH domain